MRLTIERVIDPDAIAAFYQMYVAAFDPMRTRAAARHLLTADEFAAEMADARIEKHVVRTDHGDFLGLTTLTGDLSAVAWISPDFFAARYQEQAARGALYYLGYTLVRPGRAGYGVVTVMLDRIVERLAREQAACVFDVSAHNDGRAIGRFVAAVPGKHRARVEAVDVQTYYGLTFDDQNRQTHRSDQTHRTGQAPDVCPTDRARLVSLAERPDLADRIPDLLSARWPAFILAGRPGHGVDLSRLLLEFDQYQLLLLDPGDSLLCVGLSVPVCWDGTTENLPAGWDGAVSDAAARSGRLAGRPGALCALSITSAPGAGRRGLATRMISAMRHAATDVGASALIAPVRPMFKTNYPLVPMADFVTWRTADDQPFDPWLRLHLRLGGVLTGVADHALTINGSVAQWERWTGLSLPASGAYVIPGGLVPLDLDLAADTGVYREPNVWVVHRVAGDGEVSGDGAAEQCAHNVGDRGRQPSDQQLA